MKIQAVLEPSGVIVENQVDEVEQTSKAFSEYLNKESGSYASALDQIFEKAAKQYGVDKDLLLAMGKAESNFEATATSRSGAQGIMQLMPTTASSLGVTDAYDPEQNIMGGAKYISQLIEKYGGRLSYAIAAYNAGSGNVDKYGGVPPFSETQAYVAKVLQYMEEGVSIPDSLSASKSTEDAVRLAASGYSSELLSDKLGDLSDISLREILEKYFDYNDYLEFIQLFTKILYEKVTGKSLVNEKEAENPSVVSDITQEEESAKTESEIEQEQVIPQLTMTVHSNGVSRTYTQDVEDIQDTNSSDAYIAYQNMTLGNTNRISICLMPQSTMTEA